MDLSPADDPTILCAVRLWQGHSVFVFVHPREWKRISVSSSTPMQISCLGLNFPCTVHSGGDHYRTGQPLGITPEQFNAPNHGDYEATGRIDWVHAVPEILQDRFLESEVLLATWKSLPCDDMRRHLTHIARARNEGSILNRQLALLSLLHKGP